MNRPTFQRCSRREIPSVRKEGDSNPRYGNPYGSLANCWFQPLKTAGFSHSPILPDVSAANRGVISLIAGAKVQQLFEPCKFFADFFHLTCLFSSFLSGIRDSNPRPSAWEANALPTELIPPDEYRMVNDTPEEEKKRVRTCILTLGESEPIAGLEPATHALRMRCSTN